MNKHSSIKSSGSLLERASELYGFGDALRGGASAAQPSQESAPPAGTNVPSADPVPTPVPVQKETVPEAAPLATASTPPAYSSRSHQPQKSGRFAKIDRQLLISGNFIDPDGPVSGLSEEFRIVKRQLLLSARGGKGYDPVEHGERILVCSAHPNEGKTYCSINLALSMASEKDNRVLLVDADFAKPSILATLGIDHSPGLMDALADPNSDAESYVIETDIAGLSVLPAGAQTNQDTEYLAASRTAEIIDQLTRNDPSRIIIFDSPPALAASPASVLALHVGQCLLVVNADETTDSALRDALSLLSGCDHVQLLLNRAKFSPTGRKFGNYYGYGA
ncbi:MAG: AAA family ATPase [Sphingomonadales bacterium]|nr:AAA family ATPase [Sphingomonadales bacterium]